MPGFEFFSFSILNPFLLFTVWGKIIDTVQQLGEAVSGTTAKVVEEFKPQILHALQDLKKVVVKGVKTVIIEVRNRHQTIVYFKPKRLNFKQHYLKNYVILDKTV